MAIGIEPEPESDLYEAKADFSDVYNRPDPRPYFETLGSLDYEIPAHGTPVFELLLDEMGGRAGKTVLDVCCSYGVNSALLNHDVDLDALYEHYRAIDDEATPGDVMELDRRWLNARRRSDAVTTVGLDVAEHAVRYATSVGLLDRGVVANLEIDDDDSEIAATLATADLVTVTGGIGYVGEETFRRIVEAGGDEPPWIAALNLRWIDFDPIAETLDDLGLVIEQADGFCVPQRRFADAVERDAVLAGLDARGLDPGAELAGGTHCAELFVARPPEAVRDAPIEEMLGSLIDPPH